MKRFILVLFLGSFFFSSVVASKEVTLATFNTFWLFDDKAPHLKWWTDQRGKEGQTYSEAINAVAIAIKALDADVVALQEVENDGVVKDLQEKLASIGVSYPFRWISKGKDNQTGQDVALLSVFDTTGTVINEYDDREGYLTEQDAGNEKSTGLSKVIRVDLKIGDKELPVFVLHLKSQRGGYESDRQRLAQASIVRRITLPLIHGGFPFVVMGDLNADRGSAALLRLRGFDDIYSDLYQPVHNKHFSGDKWTYRYKGRTQQIDHILLSPLLRKSVKQGLIIRHDGEAVSDHFPVVLKIEI